MADTLATLSDTTERLRRSIVEAYVRQARVMWNSLTPSDWWNDAITHGAAAKLTLIELQAVAAARRAGISYADQTLRMIGVTPRGNVPQLVYPRLNTDPWLVNARPAESYRGEAVLTPGIRPTSWPKQGDEYYETVGKWIDAALSRMQAIADTDMQAASTSSTIERYRGSKVLQYRRVLHPELSKSGSCGLCVVAADRWYSTDSLMPLHNNCKCGVAPAGSDYDPGLDLNASDLSKLYRAAGGNKASDLSNIRVRTITHGELGPILTANDAREKPNPVPGRDSEQWHTPDRRSTLEQFARMRDRAIEFSKRYKQVADSGEEVSFRYDGRSYRFAPSKHLRQAWAYQRALLDQVQSQLAA